jgi:hypothetical protein
MKISKQTPPNITSISNLFLTEILLIDNIVECWI